MKLKSWQEYIYRSRGRCCLRVFV